VKDDQVALAQRHKEQEAGTRRANQCMQDWTNQQVIERVRILEVQQQSQQSQQSQQQQPNRCKCKARKKEIKRLAERVVLLENANANANANAIIQASNPFDFNTIYDPWEREDMPALDLIANHYTDYAPHDYAPHDYAPHDYAPHDYAPHHDEPVTEPVTHADDDDEDEDEDDDDMFEVIQIFDFPQAK